MIHPLAPLSALYSAVTDVRNWMFDRGWLEEKEYGIPIVCIGNLAVGGTGKTPHTEWIVGHLLEEQKRVAILSRGYGRKTNGYHEATPESRAEEIGDEPLQMYHRFGGKAIVAVCEKRREGVEHLLAQHPDLDVIVLDDAFQHRYVRPRVRILLTEYGAPFYDDNVLPAGRLRERRQGAARADIFIVTKCPEELSEEQKKTVIDKIAPNAHQHVFFTKMTYAALPELEAHHAKTNGPHDIRIALLAGIAHPEPFLKHFEEKSYDIRRTLFYPDHHNFSAKDISNINAAADKVDLIITTAKDYARLRSLPLRASALNKIIVQHISVNVLGDETALYKTIKSYVDTH